MLSNGYIKEKKGKNMNKLTVGLVSVMIPLSFCHAEVSHRTTDDLVTLSDGSRPIL
jgi:hypothetical protein